MASYRCLEESISNPVSPVGLLPSDPRSAPPGPAIASSWEPEPLNSAGLPLPSLTRSLVRCGAMLVNISQDSCSSTSSGRVLVRGPSCPPLVLPMPSALLSFPISASIAGHSMAQPLPQPKPCTRSKSWRQNQNPACLGGKRCDCCPWNSSPSPGVCPHCLCKKETVLLLFFVFCALFLFH